MKKNFIIFIIMLASLNLGMHVYAAESKKEAFAVESTKAISGYGERYTGTGSGYFEVKCYWKWRRRRWNYNKKTHQMQKMLFVNYSIMKPDGSYLKRKYFCLK